MAIASAVITAILRRSVALLTISAVSGLLTSAVVVLRISKFLMVDIAFVRVDLLILLIGVAPCLPAAFYKVSAALVHVPLCEFTGSSKSDAPDKVRVACPILIRPRFIDRESVPGDAKRLVALGISDIRLICKPAHQDDLIHSDPP